MVKAKLKDKVCTECKGYGYLEYTPNPDNGFLDTQAHNLRTEQRRCPYCNGAGRVKVKARP